MFDVSNIPTDVQNALVTQNKMFADERDQMVEMARRRQIAQQMAPQMGVNTNAIPPSQMGTQGYGAVYGAMEAQQFQQQQQQTEFNSFTNSMSPFIAQAMKMGESGNSWVEKISALAEQSNNPKMQAYGEAIKGLKVLDDETTELTVDFSNEASKNLFIKAVGPGIKALGSDMPELSTGQLPSEGIATFKITRNPMTNKTQIDKPVWHKETAPQKEKNPQLLHDTVQNTSADIERLIKSYPGTSPAVAASLRSNLKNKHYQGIEYTYHGDTITGGKPVEKQRDIILQQPTPEGRKGKFSDEQYAEFYNKGQDPKFRPATVQGTARANMRERADWEAGLEDWKRRMGISGATAGLEYGETKADQASLQKAVGIRDAMKPFVITLDEQIKRINTLAKSVPSSTAPRILAMPINEAKRLIFGSEELSGYRLYITEIEAEVGKLATGSSASVKELSPEAQKKWAKIHDKNLPLGKMLKLLQETKNAGHMRMNSQEKVIKEINARRDRAKKRDNVKAPTTYKELLEAWMKAHPQVKKETIEKDPSFINDVKKFRLEKK